MLPSPSVSTYAANICARPSPNPPPSSTPRPAQPPSPPPSIGALGRQCHVRVRLAGPGPGSGLGKFDWYWRARLWVSAAAATRKLECLLSLSLPPSLPPSSASLSLPPSSLPPSPPFRPPPLPPCVGRRAHTEDRSSIMATRGSLRAGRGLGGINAMKVCCPAPRTSSWSSVRGPPRPFEPARWHACREKGVFALGGGGWGGEVGAAEKMCGSAHLLSSPSALP